MLKRRPRDGRQSAPNPRAGAPGPLDRESAREHYLRGNRYFERNALLRALAEWRAAAHLWRPAPRAVVRRSRPFAQLRAVLLLLLTVLLVYNVIYIAFPRDSLELLAVQTGQEDNRSWWERWLETGRPSERMPGNLGLREWWREFKRNFFEGEREIGKRPPSRSINGVPERWADLMRRHGRLGAIDNWDLDLGLISGNGLNRLGDYSSAVEILQDRVSDTWDPTRLGNLYQALANAYYYQGYNLQPNGLAVYDLQMVRKAAKAYRKSVRFTPRAMSYGNMGWMYYLLEDFERAEEYSRNALRMNSNLEYVQLNLGLIYLAQDRVFDSFGSYRDVIMREPMDEVYLGGINDLREMLRDHPGRFPHARLMIGLLAANQGDFSSARRALERFLSRPATGSSWRRLAERVLRDMSASEVER